MKKKGFTLIELLAVIIVLAIIALISTPIVINYVEEGQKRALSSSASNLIKEAQMYCESGETCLYTVTDGKLYKGSDYVATTGGKDENGIVKVDSDGIGYADIHNHKWNAYKYESDLVVNIKDYVEENIAYQSIKDKLEEDTTHIKKNVKVNGKTVDKIIGTVSEKNTMKNYVWYAGQLWQVLEIDNSANQMKLVTAQSITSIAYGTTNDWNNSWVRKWLNNVFLASVQGNFQTGPFCHDEPSVTKTQITNNDYQIYQVTGHTQINSCSNITNEKVGLLTFEDMAYAKNGNTAEYLGGSFLNEDEFTWTLTPFTGNNKNNQMWIEWYTNGYLTTKADSSNYSFTNNYGLGVRPVVYISSNTFSKSGTGTKKDPYILMEEVELSSGSSIKDINVGNYVYLDESNNPNKAGNSYVASGTYFTGDKANVRYRVVKKNSDGSVKVERADVLRNLPNTVAIRSNVYTQFYTLDSGNKDTSCMYDDAKKYGDTATYYNGGCTNHNYFLPNDGSGSFEINKGNNLAYFLNNATNSFYSWYSNSTKNMIKQTTWKLDTSGYGKDYSNLNNGTASTYPARTNDGTVSAYVGLPTWGEMYTGNDLNYSYWLINRWQGSPSHVSRVYTSGHAGGTDASSWTAVRPVVTLKSNILIGGGTGTMTNPYSLKV